MLPFVQHPPALGEVGVHARILHEVVDEDIQTAQVRRFRCHHLKNGLSGQ